MGEVRILIRLTRGDIAGLVGTARKCVIQVTLAFIGQSLIAEKDGRITVKDQAGLGGFAGN